MLAEKRNRHLEENNCRVIPGEMAIEGKWPSAAIFLVYMLRKIDFVSFKSARGAAAYLKLLSKFAKFFEI